MPVFFNSLNHGAGWFAVFNRGHIKYEHTDVQCPHCDYSVKGDKQARSNMMNDHLSYKNLVEDDEFSNLHGLTEEDRQRCVDTPGEFTFFVDELWAQAVVTVLTRTMGFAQKLANLCDPIRIYRDYKDGYKSVKVLADAIEWNTGRKELVYHDSNGNVIVPNREGRRRRPPEGRRGSHGSGRRGGFQTRPC